MGDFNNAHIKLANGSPKVYDMDVEGVNTAQGTQTGTAGATTIDASDGIVPFAGTSTKGMNDDEVVTASYKGIDGMSDLDEDDQKQEVVSYICNISLNDLLVECHMFFVMNLCLIECLALPLC